MFTKNVITTLVLAEGCVASAWTTLVIHCRVGLPFYCGIQDAQDVPRDRTLIIRISINWCVELSHHPLNSLKKEHAHNILKVAAVLSHGKEMMVSQVAQSWHWSVTSRISPCSWIATFYLPLDLHRERNTKQIGISLALHSGVGSGCRFFAYSLIIITFPYDAVEMFGVDSSEAQIPSWFLIFTHSNLDIFYCTL